MTGNIVSKIGVVLMLLLTKISAQEISIIPKPDKLEYTGENISFSKYYTIEYEETNNELKNLAVYFSEILFQLYEIKIEYSGLNEKSSINIIKLVIDDKLPAVESYRLLINEKIIEITGKSGAGIFYGIQSFLQLLPAEKNKTIELPKLLIEDSPRFSWRGVHLDVCRHFFPVSFIKKYIDIIAMYKMNTFHFHLTEDQGWRIEIKKYPKLTEVGAWRKEADGSTYGGFYTQDEIKDIIEYAKSRYITVVPEIEMPGHAVAALAAYPELSCTRGPFEVVNTWGVFDDVFCAGNENTFSVLENILEEVIQLFPSEYIHIGGDEVPKKRWDNCAKCQSRMKDENLKDEHRLQSYFIQRIEKFVNSRGKKIIGWDEILEGGLAQNAAVMSWQGIAGGIAAAKSNHYAVMSPVSHCYFDYYQALEGEPKAIGGFISLEKVYSYEPVPDTLTETEAKYILGAQANIWTEYIMTPDKVEYMLLPRLCALSEVVWSRKNQKDYNNFTERMNKHYQLLSFKGINYRKPR